MNPDGLDPERRRQRAFERLGTNEPACLHCGEDDPHCLEKHHEAGIRFMPDLTVIVCSNCHKKLSDKQKDHPFPRDEPPPPEVRLARLLLGIADHFELLIGYLRQFAAYLFEKYAKQPPSKSEDR